LEQKTRGNTARPKILDLIFEEDTGETFYMKKLIALSAVLVMGALGMACGDAPANNANANANRNTMTAANQALNTAANAVNAAANAVSNAASAVANAASNMNTKPANSNMNTNSNMNKK